MDIFLSWSGERSKRVAQALAEWLPAVLSDDAAPWFSDRDVHAGTRWAAEIARRLESTWYGIICLTPENLESPWLLFEAGAISKALDEARVCPYLLSFDPGELTGPLAQFQGKRANRNSTFEMLRSLNGVAPRPVDEPILVQRFEAMWPNLELALEQIPEHTGAPAGPARPDRDILEEIVETVRGLDRKLLRSSVASTSQAHTVPPSQVAPPTTTTDIPPAPDWWLAVVGELKRRKDALSAAVYGEAHARFDGAVLWLTFPENQDFYVEMARDSKHTDVLMEAFEAIVGTRPSEIRAGTWNPS